MESSIGNHENRNHVIDMPQTSGASTSGSLVESVNVSPAVAQEHMQSALSSSNESNTSAPIDAYTIIVYIQLMYIFALLFTSIFMLILVRHENPKNPLFTWVIGYVVIYTASIPFVFKHCFLPCPWIHRWMVRLNCLLECFFALWFVLGNYWIFNEESSSEAPDLYRFCISLLVLAYLRFFSPVIFVVMAYCCCRRLIGMERGRGATAESISALPKYKFKLTKNKSVGGSEMDEVSVRSGVVAAGTESECTLSSDNAICCICLLDYNDNDDLKAMPCSHFFHSNCLDKWLKIKGSCPLCKCEIDANASIGTSVSTGNSSQQIINHELAT